LEIKMEKLKKPKLVCTSNKCREEYIIRSFTKYHYKQICCHECGWLSHSLGHGNNLKFESKALFGIEYCSKCSCPEKEHKIVNYSSSVVIKENPVFKKKIKIHEGTLSKAEEAMKKYEKIRQSYENEKQTLLKSTAIFFSFLRKNAITVPKDCFKEKLEQRIKASLKKSNDNEIDHLNKTLQAYETEVESCKSLDVTIDDIMEMKEQLCSLKHYGDQIKEIYSMNEQAFKGDKLKEKPPITIMGSFLNRIINFFK